MAVMPQPAQRQETSHHDQRLCLAAIAALHDSRYTALHQLQCEVLGGDVELSGTVPSFYMKQMAQTAVMRIDGAVRVRNLIEVRRDATA